MKKPRVHRATVGLSAQLRSPGRSRSRRARSRAPREPVPPGARVHDVGTGHLAQHDGQRHGRQHLLHARVHEPLGPHVHAQRLSRRLGRQPLGPPAGLRRRTRQLLAGPHGDARQPRARADRHRDAADRRGGELPLLGVRHRRPRPGSASTRPTSARQGRAVPLRCLLAHGPDDPAGCAWCSSRRVTRVRIQLHPTPMMAPPGEIWAAPVGPESTRSHVGGSKGAPLPRPRAAGATRERCERTARLGRPHAGPGYRELRRPRPRRVLGTVAELYDASGPPTRRRWSTRSSRAASATSSTSGPAPGSPAKCSQSVDARSSASKSTSAWQPRRARRTGGRGRAVRALGPAGRSFDLVIAAQAWHWIEPTSGVRGPPACSRPGGACAVLESGGSARARARRARPDL